jgi:hypothetical protein
MSEKYSKAINVRLDTDTYNALLTAVELTGTKNVSAAIRQGAELFIRAAAEDTTTIDKITRQREELGTFIAARDSANES